VGIQEGIKAIQGTNTAERESMKEELDGLLRQLARQKREQEMRRSGCRRKERRRSRRRMHEELEWQARWELNGAGKGGRVGEAGSGELMSGSGKANSTRGAEGPTTTICVEFMTNELGWW